MRISSTNITLYGNKNDLIIIYKKLFEYEIVKEQELELVQKWLNELL